MVGILMIPSNVKLNFGMFLLLKNKSSAQIFLVGISNVLTLGMKGVV